MRAADVVVTMGCGDACPYVPGARYEDWELDDPAGRELDEVRPIRDQIERRVRDLLFSLGIPPEPPRDSGERSGRRAGRPLPGRRAGPYP